MGKITVYRARKVLTLDPGRPVAEAIAVMDGRVVSTGTFETMQPWLKRHEHVIDDTLAGKVVMPGSIVPHTHFATSPGLMSLHSLAPIDSPGRQAMTPPLRTHAD